MKNILVLGGGAKESMIASILGKQFNIMRFEKTVTDDALEICDVIILPLPAVTGECITGTDVSANRIFELKYKKIIGGRITKHFVAAECKSEVVDYTELDEFATRNAVPTAEAAISIAIDNTPFTIHGSNCLVTGYGRIAKKLCSILSTLNANTVCALRNISQIAQAESNGFKTIGYDDIENFRYDIVFNTVPALIFDEHRLLKTEPKLIVDLASNPGGCDFEAADKLRIKTIHALSLPGRTAPLSAAQIVADTIKAIL